MSAPAARICATCGGHLLRVGINDWADASREERGVADAQFLHRTFSISITRSAMSS